MMSPNRKMNPVMKIISKSLLDLPAPINISMWWNYGSTLGLFLSVQMMTGIFLSMHYCPNTNMAFSSIIHIMHDVNYGWMLHNMHTNGASLFLLCMYIHMARGIYYNSFYMKSTWNIGVTIFIMTMVIAFMGYVLPWGQMSFWGATVITNIFSAMPYLGTQLVQWLWGGYSVTSPTLNRFFMLHFMLPFILLLLVMLHFMMLHVSGSMNPLGINSNYERIPFHIYYTTKDIMGFMLALTMFMLIVLFIPNYLKDPENFIEANPLTTPLHIQPEWYFLWLYAILRSIPNKFGGVLALLLAIIILYLPPQMGYEYSPSFCPPSQLMFFTLLVSWTMLSWIGSCPVEEPFIKIGQMFSMLYFSYFLLTTHIMKTWFWLMSQF